LIREKKNLTEVLFEGNRTFFLLDVGILNLYYQNIGCLRL
jgi:hypothetical protein